MSEREEQIRQVAQCILEADNVLVLSGAGASAESGISTFRDPEMGLWKNKIGLALFGTPIGWKIMPCWAWKCYIQYFRRAIARAKPNQGHFAIADLERFCRDPDAFLTSPPSSSSSTSSTSTSLVAAPSSSNSPEERQRQGVRLRRKNFAIITQNVDGLHQRAGNDKDQVFEVHGSVYRHRCIRHGHVNEDLSDDVINDLGHVARCRSCGGYLRPDATLFTESLPTETWRKAERAARSLGEGNKKGVLIIIGTSGVVYPAASLPGVAASSGNNVRVVEINPVPSAYTNTALVNTFICGAGGEVMPRIIAHIRELQQQE